MTNYKLFSVLSWSLTQDKRLFEPQQEISISNNVVRATSKTLDQPAYMYMCGLIRAFACFLNIL